MRARSSLLDNHLRNCTDLWSYKKQRNKTISRKNYHIISYHISESIRNQFVIFLNNIEHETMFIICHRSLKCEWPGRLLTYVDMNIMNSLCLAEAFIQPTLPKLMIPAVKLRFALTLITLLNLLFLTLRGRYIHNKVTTSSTDITSSIFIL